MNLYLLTALALAQPIRAIVRPYSCEAKHRELSINIPSLVCNAGAELSRIVSSHLTFSVNGWVARAEQESTPVRLVLL